jgi:hypothetical protein
MKRLLLLILAAATLSAAANKPKLILAIVIDQFRYDYLMRYRSEYHAGFERLLTKGAVFTNAQYIHFPTLTAPGHSTFLSGATPSVSGIVANEWFDRDENRKVSSVTDTKAKPLGGLETEGASPRRLLVSTIGDELKLSNGGKSRTIGISLKDRAAILPAGHMADGAYWFDLKSGNFVSSDYYFKNLPGWVKDFNAARPADKYRGKTWLNHQLPADLKAMYGDNDNSPFEASPFGNEILEMFVERALAAENLGKHDATDLLAVSFSSNDKVGHVYGSYAPETHEITVLTDKVLEKLFGAIDRQVGMENVLVVLTGDHGVSPSAEESMASHMPGGRYPLNTVRVAIEQALAKQYGPGDWVAGHWDASIYLNFDTIAKYKLDPVEVRRSAAAAAFAVPHVLRVYTRDQLLNGAVPGDEITRRVFNGFNVRRSPDLSFVMEPYWVITSSRATSHGSPFVYDSHVPIVFLGPWVRAGRYHNTVAVNDIAPTLATLLDIEIPGGSVGRVLTEMLVAQ